LEIGLLNCANVVYIDRVSVSSSKSKLFTREKCNWTVHRQTNLHSLILWYGQLTHY